MDVVVVDILVTVVVFGWLKAFNIEIRFSLRFSWLVVPLIVVVTEDIVLETLGLAVVVVDRLVVDADDVLVVDNTLVVVFIETVGIVTLCVRPKSLSNVAITQVRIYIELLQLNRYKYFEFGCRMRHYITGAESATIPPSGFVK